MPIEATTFLEQKLARLKAPIFLNPRFLRSVGLRFLGFQAWRAKEISSTDALLNLLPNYFKPLFLNDKLYKYIERQLDDIFLKNGIYDAKEILLFGNSFAPATERDAVTSWLNFFILVFQIDICDQYQARRFLKRDSVVIDAGANIGIFSALAASLCHEGQIYSFEPGTNAFATLQKNLACYHNAKAINSALGDFPHSGRLYLGSSTTVNAVSDDITAQTTTTEKIEINSIDNFVREEKLKRVDFIKIDTEGYEEKVIKGASETIKKFSPIIATSAYHRKDDKNALIKLIKGINHSYNYTLNKKAEEVLIFWK